MGYLTADCLAARTFPFRLGDVVFCHLSLEERRKTAHESVLCDLDPLLISLGNPFLRRGTACVVADGGLARKTTAAFDRRFRLAGVRQLSMLQCPFEDENDQPVSNSGSIHFTHTRWAHTIDVYVLARLFAYNLRLSRPVRTDLFIAALTHDVATPAGGDAIKALHPTALDEEAHWYRFVGARATELFTARKTTEARVWATVKNIGLAGQVLNLADRIGYCSRDAAAFAAIDRDNCSQVRSLLTEQPQILHIWEDVRRVGELIYFTSARRFGQFALLRANLFAELYLHPQARSREQMLFQVLVGKMLARKSLTPTLLRALTDDDLIRQIETALDHQGLFEGLSEIRSHTEHFQSREAAEDRERALRAAGAVITRVADYTAQRER
jgi:hypothetical protein